MFSDENTGPKQLVKTACFVIPLEVAGWRFGVVRSWFPMCCPTLFSAAPQGANSAATVPVILGRPQGFHFHSMDWLGKSTRNYGTSTGTSTGYC